jgi:signal peptidase I
LQTSDRMDKMITILRRSISVLLILVTAIGLGLSALFIALSISTNFNITSINNSSMAPEIKNGSWVISEKVDSASIANNDIIVIPSNDSTVIGRVISKIEGENAFYYQIKGDNNVLPNEWNYKVGNDSYKLLTAIPFVGTIGNPFAVIITGIGIVLISVYYVFFLHKPRPKKVVEEEDFNLQPEWTAVDEIKSLFGEPVKND